MSPEVIDALVKLVANGRKFGVADTVVIEHLIEMGVPKEHAAELLSEIAHGLQQGGDAATNATGEPPTSPPASPLYIAAYTEGRRAVVASKQRQPPYAVVGVIAVVVIGVLIYVLTR